MSDEPDRPRVITAPLGAAAAPPVAEPVPTTAPMNARPATQMSAAAVPPTVESSSHASGPSHPPPPGAAEPAGAGAASDEIHGAAIVRRDASREREEAAHLAPEAGASPTDANVRRGGPATMMSPAVAAPLPGEPVAPLAPENAVIDVGAPAHAFVGYGGSAAPGGGPGMMHHGHAAGAPRRAMSTTTLVLIVGGAIAVVALVVLAAGAFLFFSRARALQERRADNGDSRQTPLPVEGPRATPRMGGARARVLVTSSGTIDRDAARVALTVALPHVDACFAANELEAPNHESATYELDVATSGEVRRAEPSSTAGRTAKLDACVVQTLRSVRMPKSSKPSVVKLTLLAPVEPR